MSYDAAAAEIRGRLKTQWGAITPIEWPNLTFAAPNPAAPWMRFTIKEGDAAQLSIGADKKDRRHPGIITLQFFDGLNKGDGPLTRLADQAVDIFQNWCGATVRCLTASVKTIGNDGQGWYQINVTIPFYWDDLK